MKMIRNEFLPDEIVFCSVLCNGNCGSDIVNKRGCSIYHDNIEESISNIYKTLIELILKYKYQ